MDQVAEAAERLGRMICQTTRYRELRAAEEALKETPDSERLYRERQEQAQKVAELEAAQKPIGPADKRRLLDLTEGVRSDELLQRLIRAQADYIEMMNRVNRAVLDALQPKADESS